ncbi:MAG: FeoA family protein [Phycisphaerae bacterium]|nr:FeoA family protein [Phycisphaerae bacterium]
MPAATDHIPSRSPNPVPLRIPLSQLKRGDRAVVELGSLPKHETLLLAAMGLADQAQVRVCRAGTPCIVQIEATRLGISAEMAARILATPCACIDLERERDGT